MNSSDKLIPVINNAPSVVIISHINPDIDAYGSTLGLAHILKIQGKKVDVANSYGLLDGYQFLPGSDQISNRLELSGDPVVVICDCGNLKRIGGEFSDKLNGHKVINIDHHASNPMYGDYQYVDVKATSTSELIYRLSNEAGWDIAAEAATCIFAGVFGDTNGFTTDTTTAFTHEMVASLIKMGADPSHIANKLIGNRSLSALQFAAQAIMSIELKAEGRFSICCIPDELISRYKVKEAEVETLPDDITGIDGVLVSAMLREINGKVRVNLRSRTDKLNVNEVASEFGGGGHLKRAGFISSMPIDKLSQKLTDVVVKRLEKI